MAEDEVTGTRFRAYQPTPDYVRVDHVAGAQLELEDALGEIAAIEALGHGEPLPVLVDIRGLRSITRDARRAFANTKVVTRLAMYVETSLSRTIANFFIGVANPHIPARVFTNDDEAQRWLVSPHE